jgi:hypothetical protein
MTMTVDLEHTLIAKKRFSFIITFAIILMDEDHQNDGTVLTTVFSYHA